MTALARLNTRHPLREEQARRVALRTWALFAATVDGETMPFAIEGDRGAGTRRPSDAPAFHKGMPAFSLTTYLATLAAYDALADSAGHLTVVDRLQRVWVLVNVAGHLRARRLFVDEVADSIGVVDADELVDTCGPLLILPSDATVRTPCGALVYDPPRAAIFIRATHAEMMARNRTSTQFVSAGSEKAS